MADRVYPSAKPNPAPPSAVNGGTGTAAVQFPATKAQSYNRPMYRPQPAPMKRRRRSSRSCCCSCCLWITLIFFAVVFIAAIAGGVFYVLYRPHRPDFTVSSLKLATFNLTAAGSLTSKLDLAVTARNPNKKLEFIYDESSIAVTSNGVGIGTGSFPAFVHGSKNTTVLKSTVTDTGANLDATAAADLRKRSTIPLEIEIDTKAGVKFMKMKTKKVGIKVNCAGISLKKKAGTAAAAEDVRCKVKLRIKIWKWTF